MRIKLRVPRALRRLLLAITFTGLSVTAFATSYTVTFTTDSGTGSGTSGDLRYCVTQATSGSDIITFSSAMTGQTITLGSELVLSNNVTIDGSSVAGGGMVTVSGNNATRIFRVTSSSSVALTSIMLGGGNGASPVNSGLGGAIYNQGQLTATGCVFTGNSAATEGGAIDFDSGSVTLTQCTFRNNSCGAGIGGALGGDGTSANITRCTFIGNTASSGGAIAARANQSTLVQCTLSGNSASADGGAIDAVATIALTQCTVVGNTASGQGGGIDEAASGHLTLTNSIVAANMANDAPNDLVNVSGSITRNGVNFIGTTAGSGLTAGSTVLTGDPKLAAPGVYGGITPTMPPLMGSPVINAASGSTVTTDQRALAIIDGHPDLGAAEALFTQVTNTNNGGPGSLSNAITTASTAGHAVSFATSLSGQTINVSGPNMFSIQSGVIIDAGNLPAGLTITNGHTGGPSLFGVIGPDVTFRGLTLSNNGGPGNFGGGAITCGVGMVALIQCTLTGNSFPQNGPAAGGGAILNIGSVLTLTRCTLSGNTAGNGGAINNSGGPVTLNQCTLSGNVADGCGGAIFSNGGVVTLTQCTVSGNGAGFGTTQPGSGGGLFSQGAAALTLTQCTVANNNAPSGGGIENENSSLTLTNSVIAGNQASTNPDISNSGGTINLQGANFVGNLSGSGLFASSTLFTGNAALSPLGSYGGLTQTMPPLADSALINAAVGPAFLTDQRGCPIVGTADIGAAESSIINPSPSNGGDLPSNPETLSWTGPAGATFQVYLGTSPSALSSVANSGTTSSTTLTVGLLSQASYFWRVDSTLGGVTFTGPVFCFNSPFNPAQTSPATTVTSGWAVLNGSADPGGQTTTAYFQYGTSANYGSSTPQINVGNGNTSVPVNYNVAGLARGTTYHYRLVIVSGGNTFVGVDQTFTTPAATSPPAWHSAQVTALTNPNANNMTDGARPGVAHGSLPLYFYKGTDSNVWCVYLNGGQWQQVQLSHDGNVSDWLAFGTAYNLCCYKGNDGKLWCVYLGSTQWTTVQLGNPPVGVTVAGDVVIDNGWNIIYYRGSDSKVYAVQWNGSQWTHTLLAGTATVKSGLTVDAVQHLLYYQGTDNKLWCYQWTGAVWQQVLLGSNTNVGSSLTVDSKGLAVYYRSSADNSAWLLYWNGSAWVQIQLNASANMSSSATSASSATPYPVQYDALYLDNNGQCQSLYWSGSAWVHVLMGDGGSALTGGLSLQPTVHWAFARRSDGNVVVFYYQ